MSAELPFASVTELARMIARKEVSPLEVVRAYLERIAARDATLRAYITVCEDSALAGAREAESALVAGRAPGALHGVPIALKDLYDTAGVATTGGSKILADRVPDADATVVRRLREAGAIVLGKLHMVEFAYGPEGLNAHHGAPRNPWDAASFCGITGLKPTYGRVSRAGVLPLAWSMDHVGPMTRTVGDAALLLRVMAGYDPADASTSVLPVPDYLAALTGDVKGLRVGLLRAFFLESATPDVRAAVERAAAALQSAGAIVDEVALPAVAHVAAGAYAVVASEALAYHTAWLTSRPGDYDPEVRTRLQLGAFVTGAHYVKGQQVRALVRRDVDAALARREVLLAPATPLTAPRLDERQTTLGDGASDVRSALIRLTRPFNFSGHPACAVPCGFSADGLPIGMQLVGRPFDEATVLRAADAYQRLTDWHTRRPVLA
ncbi:MAG: Asp-tRNA(Asn)/Glu-tRNA(Gln) amidotransferase GatCAB subunit A [Candidatus Rokuibacteriota bacterium]|nr:MAG: Asp-tRNA(Asn)/Glu-tRNA(Gln) amidotransferase GatCAB subunit A [Candidatus Rokubacteria bacterium]